MKTFILRKPQNKHYCEEFIHSIKCDEDNPLTVTIKPVTRTLEQNAKLWPMLDDVSKQVKWHGQYLKDSEWKDVFTAALKGQKAVPGIDGGFVVCGQSTSTMSKEMFSQLIELIYAFGADQEPPVEWTDEKM